MPDLRAAYVWPDLVAAPDAQEWDLWARQPFYPGPELIAYPRGPVSDAVEAPPSGLPVEVSVSPDEVVWEEASPSLAVRIAAAVDSIVWQTVAPSLSARVSAAPATIVWSGVGVTVSGASGATFYVWSDNEES